MQQQHIPLRDTSLFSTFFLDYIEHKEALAPFYNRFPSIAAFKDQLKDKGASFPLASRQVLHEVLQAQYKELVVDERVVVNLSALKNTNTFTVTTGHQLNIFTGPLYFIYKIVSVINACKQLAKAYPQFHFVPVYWMASEDHDFEEISYFRLYGKKYTWKTEQQGAVGRFDPKGLASLISELPGDVELFKEAYLKHERLSDAVRYYVNALFGNEGLVVIDADNPQMKAQLIPVIKDDLLAHSAQAKVTQADEALNGLGYATQVHAREINFFYLDNGLRGRIEKQDDKFIVVDTDLSFTTKELLDKVEKNPEQFSPNVILRPLYQEMVLPNLAYVGGPAEIVYWLQLKGVFDHFKIPFPLLMPRNFALVMSGPIARKFEKTGFTDQELFEGKNYLFNHWVLKNTAHNLSLTEEREKVAGLYDGIKRRAKAIDVTLAPLVAAEAKRAARSFEKIESKLLRAEKRKQADKLRQIDEVKEALFPQGSLQERTDNFLNFYQTDKAFIKKMAKALDPFDFQFNLLRYPFA